MNPVRVLLTGAAGHLGRQVLAALRADPSVHSVTALDWRAPSGQDDTKLRWLEMDIRDPAVSRHCAGVDVVVHLAWAVFARAYGGRLTREQMREINVQGTMNLVRAARDGGVHRVIFAGSVAAYGAWPDNPVPLDEDWPCRPMPGFSYAQDKHAVEKSLDECAARAGMPQLVRLRLHAIIGPHSQRIVNAIALSPVGLRLPDRDAMVQCVHEDDAVAAILAAMRFDGSAIFNIAAPGPIAWASIPRRLSLPVPIGLLDRAHRLAAHMTGAFGDPGWLPGLRHPIIVDTARAQAALGWRARWDVAGAIARLRDARNMAHSTAR